MPKIAIPIGELSEIEKRRFWEKVARGKPDECWPWMAGRKGSPPFEYGHFYACGRLNGAHRVSYVLKNGNPPLEKPFVLHRCDNPICVNPDHLFAGNDKDNMRDMQLKGREVKPKGLLNGQHTQPHRRAFGARNGMHTHPESRVKGEGVWISKLTKEKVVEIRSRCEAGESYSSIARELSMHVSTISEAARRETWRHVL